MNGVAQRIGEWLGRWLTQSSHVHGTSMPAQPDLLARTLQPCDVLLVEGNTRVSVAIKYLTQSTWSHAALYVGERGSVGDAGAVGQLQKPCFVEADIVDGIRLVGLSEYDGLHCRICRPVGLADEDRKRLIDFALARVGHRYDLKNVFDLARYLIPTPPVPLRWRRRMLSLGSGDPTRAICSTLIAQCFEAVRYPVLPDVEVQSAASEECPECVREVLRIRHHSLFVPRDFDVSPYFRIVKPTLEQGFDYRGLTWGSHEDELVSGKEV